MLHAAKPWRTFRWHTRQKRTYWGPYRSSMQSDHVIYESRPETARLLYADFDFHGPKCPGRSIHGVPVRYVNAIASITRR